MNKDTLNLGSATIFIEKDTPAQVFFWECLETFARTPTFQSLNKWMENLTRDYSEAAVHRLSSS